MKQWLIRSDLGALRIFEGDEEQMMDSLLEWRQSTGASKFEVWPLHERATIYEFNMTPKGRPVFRRLSTT